MASANETASAHTAGPWYIASPVVDSSFVIKSDDDNDLFIAAVGGVDDPQSLETIEANARLIALAPEVLNALCLALGMIEPGYPEADDDPDVKQIRSVIARARGEAA